MSPLPTRDPAVLQGLRAEIGDDAVIEQIVASWCAETPALLASLAGLHADLPALGRLAHRIKGSALSLGLGALASICQRLEVDARNGAGGAIPGLLAAAEAELGACIASLRTWKTA